METTKTYKIISITKQNPIFICKAIPIPNHNHLDPIFNESPSKKNMNILSIKQEIARVTNKFRSSS